MTKKYSISGPVKETSGLVLPGATCLFKLDIAAKSFNPSKQIQKSAFKRTMNSLTGAL